MAEIMCPHCPNMIDDTDTTCRHCGEPVEPVEPLNILTELCIQFGIPQTIEQNGEKHVVYELRCKAEDIKAVYIVPGEDQKIEMKGVLH